MSNEFDTQLFLRVYAKITRFGEHSGHAHHLGGISAFSDFDGYNIFLQDKTYR